jgi:hypothetical protein
MCENLQLIKAMPFRSGFFIALFAVGITFTGCSSTPQKQTKVFGAGEKVQVARMTYSVIDVQIQPTLPGTDAANPRVPQNRFYSVQISVSNGGNEDTPIPGLALVDDTGHVYNELADGSGVPQWMGMVRRVSPGQTEEGSILFDAPTAHYKLRFTDETDLEQIYADIPLNFVHEVGTGGGVGSDLPLGAPPSRGR